MKVSLPEPRFKGTMSVEEALLSRRSHREYTGEPLTLEEVSQLLWASQGITHPYGFRTAPSAGALYPLEIYIHATKVLGLEVGVYKYDPFEHLLLAVRRGDFSRDIYRAGLSQDQILYASLIVMFFAVFERTTVKYGKRGIRYVFNEVGHAGQNLYLQATALGLGTVAIGAFYEEELKSIVGSDPGEEPLYIMPVGKVE